MQRKKPKEEQKNKLTRKQKKAAIKLGNELRHCLAHKKSQNPTDIGRAKEIIHFYGSDPLVINASGQMLWTPIFKAILHDHLEMADLIEQAPGFDPNHKDVRGCNILLFMMDRSRMYHTLITSLLARDDMDFTATTKRRSMLDSDVLCEYRGASALFFATIHPSYFQYVPVLIEKTGKHANVYVEHKKNTRSSHYYVMKTPIENLVDALHLYQENKALHRPTVLGWIKRLSELPMPATKKRKQTRHPRDYALVKAVEYGDSEVVNLLLQAGADHSVAKDGMPITRWAELNGQKQLAQQILSFHLGDSVYQPPQQAAVSLEGMFAQSAVSVNTNAPAPSAPPDENSNNVPPPQAPPAAELEADDLQQAKAQSMRPI